FLDGASGQSASAGLERRAPRSPDRSDVRRRRWRSWLVCFSWWLAQLLFWGIRPDLPSLSLAYLSLFVLLPAAVAALCSYAAQAPGRWGRGASRSLLILLAVAGPLAFGAVALTAPAPAGVPVNGSPLHAGLVCVGLLLGWMSVPLLGTTRALRGAFA